MITVQVSNKQLHEIKANGYVIFCEQGKPLTKEQAAWCTPFFAESQQILDAVGFSGATNACHVITGLNKGKPAYLIFAGIGLLAIKQVDKIEHYRRALGNIIRVAERFKMSTLAMPFLHAKDFGIDDTALAKETLISLEMSIYHFDQFITDKKRHVNEEYTITICAPTSHHDAIEVGAEMGIRIGHAVNQARQWCDLPVIN